MQEIFAYRNFMIYLPKLESCISNRILFVDYRTLVLQITALYDGIRKQLYQVTKVLRQNVIYGIKNICNLLYYFYDSQVRSSFSHVSLPADAVRSRYNNP